MLYFPQLETLTAGQYPLRRERHERVVRHESRDGRLRAYYDGNASRIGWVLQYEGLTDAERGAIDSLFNECEGRLQDFVFLDPAANLLRWSEDYSQGAWAVEPMIAMEPGPTDRWDRFRSTKVMNNGVMEQRISQTIAAPGSLHYCFSAWIQGTERPFRLRIVSGGVVFERDFVSRFNWKRFYVAGKPGSNAESVTFSLEIDPSQTIYVSGLQVETQPAPGAYRHTNSRCGVYPNARFADDQLVWTQQAPNNNAATIRIVGR